jgi:hypothetical protein
MIQAILIRVLVPIALNVISKAMEKDPVKTLQHIGKKQEKLRDSGR